MSPGPKPPKVSSSIGTQRTPACSARSFLVVARHRRDVALAGAAVVVPVAVAPALAPPENARVGRLRRVAEADVRATLIGGRRLRAERVVDLQVEGGEVALDEQRDVRPVVRVAVVVVGLAPRLAAIDTPQRIEDGAVDEEVPRLVAALAVSRRSVLLGFQPCTHALEGFNHAILLVRH